MLIATFYVLINPRRNLAINGANDADELTRG